jgi:hypothetical protein
MVRLIAAQTRNMYVLENGLNVWAILFFLGV